MSFIATMNLFLAICFVPILFVMYFTMRNEVKPKNNIILSTTLPKEAWEDPRVLAIKKKFSKEFVSVIAYNNFSEKSKTNENEKINKLAKDFKTFKQKNTEELEAEAIFNVLTIDIGQDKPKLSTIIISKISAIINSYSITSILTARTPYFKIFSSL